MKQSLKNFILVTILSLLLATPFFAFDWGGTVGISSTFKGMPNKSTFLEKGLSEKNEAVLWFSTPLDKNKTMYLSGEALYNFRLYFNLNDTKKIAYSQTLDLPLLKFSAKLPLSLTESVTFNFGRYKIQDLSSIVLSQPLDGLDLGFETLTFKTNIYMGYTGLLNSHTVFMNAPAFEPVATDFYSLSAKYFVSSITFSMPALFADQTLSTEFNGVWDISKANYPKMYGSVSLNGRIVDQLFYVLNSTLGLTVPKTNAYAFSNLSQFHLSFFPGILDSSISWNTFFATGKSSIMSDFETITTQSSNIGGNLSYAGLIKTGLTGSIKPTGSLLFTIGSDVFFNVMDAKTAKGYKGVQWLSSARWDILNDIQLSAAIGQYIPAVNLNEHYLFANIKLIFAF